MHNYASQKSKVVEPFRKITDRFMGLFVSNRPRDFLCLSALYMHVGVAVLDKSSVADVTIRPESQTINSGMLWTEKLN